MPFLPLCPWSFFCVQEFILEDDITNEALGPSNCVLGLNTPSTTFFFVPNATFVGVVLGPKRPFVVAIFLGSRKFSIVFFFFSPMRPFVIVFVPGLKAPYVIGP
jgi:hypothetical protein